MRIFNYKSSLKKHQKEHRNQIIADSLTNDNSIKKKIVTERLKENSNDPDEKIKTYPQEREIQIINQINQNIFCSLFASMQQNWQITNPYSIVNRELLKLKMDLNPHINEILTNEITIQIKHKDHFDYLYRGRLFNIKDSYIEEHFFDEDTQNSTICKPLKEISHIPSLSMMKSKYEQITQNYGIPLDNLSSLNSCTALTCGGPKNSKVSDEEKPQTLQSSTGSVQGNEEDLITTKDKILTSLSANDEKETSDCSTTGKCCCQSKNGDIHDNSKSECCTGEKETNREKSDIKKSVKFAMNQKQSTGSCCQNKSSLMCGSACQKSCQPKSEKSSSKKNQGGCCQKSTLDTGCGCSSRDNSCFCSLTKVLKHHHSLTCGHPYIIHKGHLDFIVEGRLHHPHDDHCDDHGLLEILDPSFDGLDQDIENNL